MEDALHIIPQVVCTLFQCNGAKLLAHGDSLRTGVKKACFIIVMLFPILFYISISRYVSFTTGIPLPFFRYFHATRRWFLVRSITIAIVMMAAAKSTSIPIYTNASDGIFAS